MLEQRNQSSLRPVRETCKNQGGKIRISREYVESFLEISLTLSVLITEPLLRKSIEDYRHSIHLMSSKGTVSLDCDYSCCCLTPLCTCILLLMIYNVGGEDEFGDSLVFFHRFCLEIMLAHTFTCLPGHARMQFYFFNYRIQNNKKYPHQTKNPKHKKTSPLPSLKNPKMVVVLWPLLLPVLFH